MNVYVTSKVCKLSKMQGWVIDIIYFWATLIYSRPRELMNGASFQLVSHFRKIDGSPTLTKALALWESLHRDCSNHTALMLGAIIAESSHGKGWSTE
jgi:hypothetical protein